MKIYFNLAAALLLISTSIYCQEKVYLSNSFIQNNLELSYGTYLDFENNKSYIPHLTSYDFPTLTKIKDNQILKEFEIELSEFSFNLIDSTISIKGKIIGISTDYLPPNVLIITTNNSFNIKISDHSLNQINSTHRDIIGTGISYSINKYFQAFSVKSNEREVQILDCKLKVSPFNCNIILFARHGYKVKVINLKSLLPVNFFEETFNPCSM